jgi:hypothetical protein
MSDLNLLYTDVEEDLRTTVRALVAERCGPGGVIAMADGDRGLVGPLWKSLTTELGLAGLLVAEDRGGAGASAREAAVVLEELGRAIAPVPFLTSAVMATEVLRESESPLLSQLAEGTVTAALVVPFSVAPQAALPALSVVDGAVTGKVTSVAGALEADVLLVPVRAEDGIDLYAIESDHADVVSVVSLDMTRQLADVSFDAAAAVLVLHDAEGEVRRAVGTAAGLLASEQLGVARADLRVAVLSKAIALLGSLQPGASATVHELIELIGDHDPGNPFSVSTQEIDAWRAEGVGRVVLTSTVGAIGRAPDGEVADERGRQRALALLARRGFPLEAAYDSVRALERKG